MQAERMGYGPEQEKVKWLTQHLTVGRLVIKFVANAIGNIRLNQRTYRPKFRITITTK